MIRGRERFWVLRHQHLNRVPAIRHQNQPQDTHHLTTMVLPLQAGLTAMEAGFLCEMDMVTVIVLLPSFATLFSPFFPTLVRNDIRVAPKPILHFNTDWQKVHSKTKRGSTYCNIIQIVLKLQQSHQPFNWPEICRWILCTD
jgi:hypothetical protein